MENDTSSTNSMELVPRRLDIIPHPFRQLGEKTTKHQRYLFPAYPQWLNFSSQQHVRQAAVDVHRNLMWMATWGGVLAWNPQEQICIRYSSEHGLVGNATATIAVDNSGTVWAGRHKNGLSSLCLGDQENWLPHQDLQIWTISKIAGCLTGGIYLALA